MIILDRLKMLPRRQCQHYLLQFRVQHSNKCSNKSTTQSIPRKFYRPITRMHHRHCQNDSFKNPLTHRSRGQPTLNFMNKHINVIFHIYFLYCFYLFLIFILVQIFYIQNGFAWWRVARFLDSMLFTSVAKGRCVFRRNLNLV